MLDEPQRSVETTLIDDTVNGGSYRLFRLSSVFFPAATSNPSPIVRICEASPSPLSDAAEKKDTFLVAEPLTSASETFSHPL